MDKKELIDRWVFATMLESKLPVKEKIKIMKESSEIQLKAFLLDGYVPELDENAEQIVEKRFMMAVKEGFFTYGNWVALSHRHAHEKRQYYIKTKCHGVHGEASAVCKANADMVQWDEYEKFLKQGEGRCAKADGEAKCKERFQRAYAYIRVQKSKVAEKLARLKREASGAKVKVF